MDKKPFWPSILKELLSINELNLLTLTSSALRRAKRSQEENEWRLYRCETLLHAQKNSYQRETKDRESDESLEVKKAIKYHSEPEAQTHKQEKGSKRGEMRATLLAQHFPLTILSIYLLGRLTTHLTPFQYRCELFQCVGGEGTSILDEVFFVDDALQHQTHTLLAGTRQRNTNTAINVMMTYVQQS